MKRIIEQELHPWHCPGCGYDSQRERCPECGLTREQYVAVLKRERPWRTMTVVALLPGIAATVFWIGVAVWSWNSMAFVFCLIYVVFCATGAIAGAVPFIVMRWSRVSKEFKLGKWIGAIVTALVGSIVPMGFIGFLLIGG